MSKTFEERLEAHPELKAQMEALLDIAESDIEKADDVELLTVDSIQVVGRQVRDLAFIKVPMTHSLQQHPIWAKSLNDEFSPHTLSSLF